MPELPEVEVTRSRLELELCGKTVDRVVVRAAKLRLPIPEELGIVLPGLTVASVKRRGKYLLFDCGAGWLVIHLGMTGFLRVVSPDAQPGKHDHLDLLFVGGPVLRFHDPRKFGTVLWCPDDPLRHPLLAGIGVEPLTDDFDGGYLFAVSRSRSVAIKQFIMNAAVVAGVGNIYANEALFRAGIRPERPTSSLSLPDCNLLAETIKEVLAESVAAGSSYRVAEETVAYHPLDFRVYGRGGGSCSRCGMALAETRLGNRSTVWCPRCQH